MYAFPKFKNDDIISAKSSFYCFFNHILFRGRREFVLYACENDEKNGPPLNNCQPFNDIGFPLYFMTVSLFIFPSQMLCKLQ